MFHKKKISTSSESLWLVGYSDLVTAILSVLVLFVSFSKIDIDKFDHIQNLLSNTKLETLSQINKKIKTASQKYNLKQFVSTNINKRGLEINFASVAQFKQSSWVINKKNIQKLMPVLQEIILQSKYRNIIIIGHTDDVPYHEKYNGIYGVINLDNWSLSALRAHSLQEFLLQKGLNEKHTKIIARSDTDPKVQIDLQHMTQEKIKDARLTNRRVSIIIGRLHR